MQDCIISITGGDLNLQVEAKNIPMRESGFLKKDSKLSFKSLRKGSRSYL